jgi:hypothetical protein
MPSIRYIIAPLLAVLLLCAASASADSIRVDGDLISVGDSKLRLLQVLGKPDHSEVITLGVDTDRRESRRERPKKVEIWYYMDVNDLDYAIHLENSRIVEIEWERRY